MELNAQTDDAASAATFDFRTKSFGGEYDAVKEQSASRRAMVPESRIRIVCTFGVAAVHGGIDLSWGMYANKSWEDGTVTPEEYWALADSWNPARI